MNICVSSVADWKVGSSEELRNIWFGKSLLSMVMVMESYLTWVSL